ncbi:hypothetical protein [Succinivibrio sp.]|uniref:hypothetical protein n=1 Tax=Succinivibrio sp. TaxID=2053619 RepID=UPI0025D62ABD|nr:hypothetical protein [Succinivibrio sp.]MBQ9220421.1 hypothetical protein [Succinivibrio sp.]
MFKYQMTEDQKKHKYGDLVVYVDYFDYLNKLNGNPEKQHEELCIWKGHNLEENLADEEVWIIHHRIWHEDNREDDVDAKLDDIVSTENFISGFCVDEEGNRNEQLYAIANDAFRKQSGKNDLLEYAQSIRELELQRKQNHSL